MQRPNITLVLGAGSSCAFGFPTGLGLRKQIIDYLGKGAIPQLLGVSPHSMNQFINAFSESQLNSIDAYLGRVGTDSEVGKRLVAYALLSKENSATLFDDVDDHWYRYMLNEIVNPVSKWEDLDLSWLSIVTFNYDRSLEHYLTVTLGRIYQKFEADVFEKLEQLKIVHVYGSLGDYFDASQNRIPFGNIRPESMDIFVNRAAKEIRVVPEGRIDAPSFETARTLLRAAKKVYFLGFGFDKVNIERLGAPEIFLNEQGSPKAIHSTVLGLTEAEISLASRRLVGANMFADRVKSRALNGHCLELLRQTLPFTV